jgi:hypothetical protein
MNGQQDLRARAFNALLPVASVIKAALDEVNAEVAADRARNSRSRSGWTRTQRMAISGYGRFCWAIERLSDALGSASGANFVSTPEQESRNVFLWQLGPKVTLRVKRDPDDLREEQTEQLFREASDEADQTACLTWRTNPDLTMDSVRFVSVHGDHWTIPLIELLAVRPANVVSGSSGGPNVTSRRSRSERGEGAERQ